MRARDETQVFVPYLVLIIVKYLGLMKMVILSTFNQVKILFMLCMLWKILLSSDLTCWNQKLLKRRFFTTSQTDCHLLCQKVCQRISVISMFPENLNSTTSKTDCHLLCQKVCQKISVIITNTCVFARVFSSFSVFKTKHELNAKINYFFNIIKRVDYWDFLMNFLTW